MSFEHSIYKLCIHVILCICAAARFHVFYYSFKTIFNQRMAGRPVGEIVRKNERLFITTLIIVHSVKKHMCGVFLIFKTG